MSQLRQKRRSSAAAPPATACALPDGDWLWLKSVQMNLTGSGVSGLRTENQADANRLNIGIDKLDLVASPFDCLEAPIHLKLAAEDVRLSATHTGPERAFSLELKDGRLAIEVNRNDLEALILKLANEALRSENIAVTAVELHMESLAPRALRLKGRLTARKGFVSATLDATGLLVVNNELHAGLEDFQLRGRGVVAALIARYLRPQLKAITEQQLALGTAVLGCLSLQDIEFHASEQLRIVARFGSIVPAAKQGPPVKDRLQQSAARLQTGKRRQFNVYIIDTGWNKETRRLLDEGRACYATYLEDHVVYDLTPGQSEALLRAHPDLVGTDPIVLAIDAAAAAERRTTGLGFRYNMGAVQDRREAKAMLRTLLKILGEQRQAADITAAVRRHARKEGFRGALNILDGSLTGFSAH